MADLQPINGEYELRRKLAGAWTPHEAAAHLLDPQPDIVRKRAVVDQFLANAYDRPLAEIESTRDYWRKEWWGEGASEDAMHADVAGVAGMSGAVDTIEGARSGQKQAPNKLDQVLSGGLWMMQQEAKYKDSQRPAGQAPETVASVAFRESGLGEPLGNTLFGKSFAQSVTSMVTDPMIALAEYAHLHETAKQLTANRQTELEKMAPDAETAAALRAAQTGGLDDKLTSPEWWAVSGGQGLGSIVPFMLGGSVVGLGAAGMGAPAWLSSIIAGVAGGTAESAVNAGSAVAGIDERKAELQAMIEETDRLGPAERFTRYGVAGELARAEYQKQLNNLDDPEQARELADNVFRQNVALNSVLGAFSVGIGSKLIKEGAVAMAARLPKATGVALLWGAGLGTAELATETGQEVGQNVIERKNLDAIAKGMTRGAALELWPVQAVRAIINPEAYPEDFDTICATSLVAWKGAATSGLVGLGEMKTSADKLRYARRWTADIEKRASEGSVYHQELAKKMREMEDSSKASEKSIAQFTANLWKAAKKQAGYVFNRAAEAQTADEIAEINPDEAFSPDEAEEAAAGMDAIAAEVQAQDQADPLAGGPVAAPAAENAVAPAVPAAVGAHHQSILAAVQKIQRAFPDALPVDVVAAESAPQGGVVNGQRVEAFYQKQADGSERLAIVADNITPEQVVKVWAHEQAHRGLELLFKGPEAKAAFLEQVRRSITPEALVGLLPKTGVSAKNTAANLDVVQAIAAEEYLARLAEKVMAGETLTPAQRVGWQAFKARVAEWVRRTGRALGMDLRYTERELDELAAMMLAAGTGQKASSESTKSIESNQSNPSRSFKVAKATSVVPSPLADFVRENGGLRPLKDATNPGGEYDGEADLRAVDPQAKLLRGTLSPDQMAMMARDAGLIPDAYPATLWKALVGEIEATKRGRAEEAAAATDEKQAQRFDKDVLNDTTNPLRVPVANLRVGDAVQVGSETLKVTDIDPDTNDVTLEDGKKYGVRQVAGNEVLYVDKAEYAPEDGETRFRLGVTVTPEKDAGNVIPLSQRFNPATPDIRFRLGEQASHKEIDRERLKELGYTTNIKEAGYITPAGKLIDLSGKREGGSPGHRSYDHREAGGTKGMQEFGAEGNIRIDSNSGIADMYAMPTPSQMQWIERLAEEADGLQLELQDGLGEETDDYYQQPKRRWSGTYDADAVRKAAGDIRRFYAGEPMPDEGVRFSLSDTLPPLDEKERTIAGAFAFRMARGASVTEKTVARRLADVGAMPGKAREVLAAAKDMAAEIASGKIAPANDEQLLRALSAQAMRERYREKVFSAYANADEARQVYEAGLKRIAAWEQGKTSRDVAARSGLSEDELSAVGLANLPARLRRVLDESRIAQEYDGKIKGADVKPPADAAAVEGGEPPRYVRQSPPNDGTRTGEPMTAEEVAALNPPPPPEWIIVDPVSLEEMRTKILGAVEKKLRAEGWTPRGKVTYDPVFLAEYRKTLAGVLRDTVFENVTAGPRQERLMAAVFALQDREATLQSIDRQALDIVNRTAAALAKADADTFARQIDRLLKLQVLRGPGKSRQELIERKIHPSARTWLRLVKSIYTMKLDQVDALVNEPGAGLLALRDQYGMGVPADQEATVRKRLAEVTDLVNREPVLMAQDVDELLDDVIRALRLYGGIRERTPAQIEQAAAELLADFEGGVEKIQKAREERKSRLEPLRKAWISALRKLPAKDQKAILDGYAENSYSLYGQMVDFVRGEKNPERYAEAVAAARELSMAIERADRKAHQVAFDRTQALEKAIRRIYGTEDSALVLRELREPQEKFRQFSRGSDNLTRPLSRANLLMILSAWDQKRYRDNLVSAGRSAAEMGQIRKALGMRDLALLDFLRGQYDAFRPEMSALSQEITGLPIISPDPLYHPFVAKRPGQGLSEIHVTFPTLHGGFEARVRHGYDVDETADVIGVYMDRAHSDGRALGAAPLQQDLRYVFGHQDTWQAMERRLGKDVTQGFIDHVTEAVVGRAIKGDRTKTEWMRRARYMTTLFAMSYNVGSAMRQVAAVPGFLVYEDAGTVARASGLFFSDHAAWSAALAEMKADPSYRYWEEHGYNAAVDEVMSQASPNGVAKFFRAGMKVPAAGIQLPTALVGPGLYITYRDRLLAKGWQEPTARKEAMAQVTWLINHSQGSAAVPVQSAFWRHGGEAQKALQQFMGPVAQLAEWDLRAIREVKAGTPGAWKRARNVLLVNHVLIPAVYETMNVIWKGLRGDFSGDDKDKELEKAAKEGILAMLLGPVGGLFLVGPIVESVARAVGDMHAYGRGGLPMADLVIRLGNDVLRMAGTLKETLWDDKDVQEALGDWAAAAGDAAGRVLPPVRDVRKAAKNYGVME